MPLGSVTYHKARPLTRPVERRFMANLPDEIDCSLVNIAQVAGIDPAAAWRCLRANIGGNKRA